MEFLYFGGLQIRSESSEDPFFKIRTFTNGEFALHKLYPEINEDDIPIAQDCFGDQFLIRNNEVIKLYAETGDIEKFNLTWDKFLEWVASDPIENLEIPENLNLEVGQLLLAYPPFSTAEGTQAQIRPAPGKEVIVFHAELAKFLQTVKPGEKFKISIK